VTAGAAVVAAAARMGPLALVATPFGRAWGARAVVAALLTAMVVPAVMAQTGEASLPVEILVGLLLGIVAALPFAAAEAAGALVGVGVHPWRSRDRDRDRGALAEAFGLFAMALFAVADGPRLVAVAAGRSYGAWPIGKLPSVGEIVGVGAGMVVVAVNLAAPALAAMVVAELVLVLVGRAQPAIGRAVDAAPLRALVGLFVAAAAVYAGARALAPVLMAAAHLQVAP
jgi:flagellar biosynthetic protein FliR